MIDQNSASCGTPEEAGEISAGTRCLTVRAEIPDKLSAAAPLIVYLHGSNRSNAGPAVDNILTNLRINSREPGSVVVALLPPGYYLKEPVTEALERFENERVLGNSYEVVLQISAALRNLKAHFRADKLVVIGRWSGATATALVLGLQPGIIDRAILLHCPCDVWSWSAIYRNRPGVEIPEDFFSKIPRSSEVLAFVDSKLRIFDPALPAKFAKSLAENSPVDARFIEVSAIRNRIYRTEEFLSEFTILSR